MNVIRLNRTIENQSNFLCRIDRERESAVIGFMNGIHELPSYLIANSGCPYSTGCPAFT